MDAHNAAEGSTEGTGAGCGEPVAATIGSDEAGRMGLGWLALALALALARGNTGGRT